MLKSCYTNSNIGCVMLVSVSVTMEIILIQDNWSSYTGALQQTSSAKVR